MAALICRPFLCNFVFHRKSNAGVPGLWAYKLGYGAAIEEPNPDILTEEPVVTDNDGVEPCDGRCSSNSVCDGQCCVCKPQFYGNGVSCTNGRYSTQPLYQNRYFREMSLILSVMKDDIKSIAVVLYRQVIYCFV